MPDGQSTGAGRALEEVHAPLGGPQWLLCVLVAQGLFLGHSWSRRRTGSDTRLPRGRLSARVTPSLEGCGVYPGPPWPGKCRLRPGPVISGASRKRVGPITPNRVCRQVSTDGGRWEDSGTFLRGRRERSPDCTYLRCPLQYCPCPSSCATGRFWAPCSLGLSLLPLPFSPL